MNRHCVRYGDRDPHLFQVIDHHRESSRSEGALRVMRLLLFGAAACLTLPAVSVAQETAPPPQVEQPADPQEVPPLEAQTDETPTDAESEADPETESATSRAPANPCEVRRFGREARLDKYRREIFETVCETAARFDGFFGSRRFDEEARRTHGRAGLRLLWDEHDGLDLDGTLKVNVDFPNLDHRVNLFLGRDQRDAVVTGTENDLDFLPTFFEREGGQEWLVGLGYRPVSSDRSSLDFDVGIEIDTPVDPWVQSRYRHYWLLGDDNLLRARQTVYYTREKKLGFGTRLDFERPFGSRTLARWTGNVHFDDETEGGDWDTGVTLYHGFSPDRAVSWFVGVNGESGREVPIQDYGTRFVYRQRMLREWFFGEVITGVTWPRDNLQEQRELAYHIGFGFEIQFSGEDLGIGRR